MSSPIPSVSGRTPIAAGVRGTRSADHLDMIRGVAAVAVLLFHVRYRFFLDFAEVPDAGGAAIAWYVLTAFGHDAVMVFFVVSGLLVGAATVREARAGRWNWASYATARGVRLYVVLLPGLLLTMFWDQLGLSLFGDHAIYTGAPQTYAHDYFSVRERTGWSVLLANAGFLQGIAAPTFGSNDALWSLAYEFWYYVAFPLLAVAAIGGVRVGVRLVSLAAALAVLYMAGPGITLYFPIWLLGALVGLLPSSRLVTRHQRRCAWLCGAAFGLWLLAGHTGAVQAALGGSLLALDSLTGAVFAAWLYVLLHDRRAAHSGVYGKTGRLLAGMSYTLYVVHLPLLVFLRAFLAPGEPWRPTGETLLLAGGVAALAFGYAWVLAWLTELRTGQVRRLIDAFRESMGLAGRAVVPRSQALP